MTTNAGQSNPVDDGDEIEMDADRGVDNENTSSMTPVDMLQERALSEAIRIAEAMVFASAEPVADKMIQ